MKLTASGEPFGEKKSRAELMESIKKEMMDMAGICGVSEGEAEEMWNAAWRDAIIASSKKEN